MYKKLFFFFILLQSPFILKAQDMIGLTSSNYSGISGAMINPSSLSFMKTRMDIRILGNQTFGFNTAYYIPAKDNKGLGFINTPLPVYGSQKENYIYYNNKDQKQLYIDQRILGPAFSLTYKKHTIGFSTQFRAMATSDKIPYELPIIQYEGLKYKDLHNIRFSDFEFSAATQAWAEFALSYSYVVHSSFANRIAVGASLKLLKGNTGAYLENQNVNFFIGNDTTIYINNLIAKAGYSSPLHLDSKTYDSDPTFKGSGVGLDIGFTYMNAKRAYEINTFRKRQCEIPYDDYNFKFGVSILDIGAITYNQNARAHFYDGVSAKWKDPKISFDSFNGLFHTFDTLFYGKNGAGNSVVAEKITIGLPTALSIQGDIHINKNWYTSVLYTQPIKLYKYSLTRPAFMGITPRYETRNFEAGIPLSLLSYTYPQVGMYMRFGFFTIGTEQLLNFLGWNNLNGANIYFSFKINLQKGSCFNAYESPCHSYRSNFRRK
ncbi:MAG: DUF5723 family protein [Bacteroidales bacterium]